MPDKHQHIICPNCGFHTSEHYCARCGQETHLHKETFWGLIMHFIGHYFHYDSKFWQTMKALWFSPGKLTLAYRNKQRMRYIPPISLYIFVSVVFFLVFSLVKGNNTVKFTETNTHSSPSNISVKTTDTAVERKWLHSWRTTLDEAEGGDSVSPQISSEEGKEIIERFFHMVPKVFFFMIPLMGFLLLLLFHKRKELTYVDHIIFALHYHTFWFSIMLLRIAYPVHAGKSTVGILAVLASVVYFIIALRAVYGIKLGRSIWYSVITALVYFVVLAAAVAAIILLIVRDYPHLT